MSYHARKEFGPTQAIVGLTSCVFVEAIKVGNFIARYLAKCLSSVLKRLCCDMYIEQLFHEPALDMK